MASNAAEAVRQTPRTGGVAGQTNAAASDSKYFLRVGDAVDVQVFGEPELASKGQIDPNGNVSLALLGKVRIAGMSAEQAAKHIREQYMVEYLVNPIVSLQVTEFAKNRITVLGQVKTPGVYTFSNTETLNVLQAIARAGGYTRIGEPSKILVKRVVDGRETTIKVNANAMAKDAGTEILQVQAEDTITVGETMF